MPDHRAVSAEATATRALAWSRYWASGVRHSCPGSFGAHYGSATQAFWRAQFGGLAADDRVLELGCGNGSLIRFLGEVPSHHWPGRVDGVDLAQLNFAWAEELHPDLRRRVYLHANTPADALPMTDGTVTRVFSQFALEYFASESVWRELGRVLAPRAGFAAIAHRRGSHPYRLAEAERAHCDWLLQPGGAIDQAERMLTLLASAPRDRRSEQLRQDPDAEAARREFNAAFAALAERAERVGFGDILHDVAERTMRLLSEAAAIGEGAARAALAELRADLVDNRLRVAELVAHALDRDAVQDWVERLRALGFARLLPGDIVEQGYMFGWSLSGLRT